MTADAAEKWLEENAIRCERFELRISPHTCQTYQREWPIRCQGCAVAGVTGPLPVAEAPKGWRRGVRIKAKHGTSPYPTHYQPKGDEVVAKIALCACGCGKKGKILARGLLASCYEKARKEGKRDQFPTTIKTAGHLPAAGKMAGAAPSVGEMLAPEMDPGLNDPPLIESPRAAEHKRLPGAGYDASVFAQALDAVLGDVRKTLLAKNAAYGDSALNPVRIFSKADPVEQLRVRIDDKLSRLIRGQDTGEDTEGDLLGYLMLLRVANRRSGHV
jgi:hypothetical protein